MPSSYIEGALEAEERAGDGGGARLGGAFLVEGVLRIWVGVMAP